MIKKIRNKQEWKVVSHTTGKLFGTYKSKAKAKLRLKQIGRFGNKK